MQTTLPCINGPILVIGGGPSVPSDLEQVSHIEFAAVVSANTHGFKTDYEPTYMVVGDRRHSETREDMAPIVKAYNTPIISRWEEMADYKLEEYTSRFGSSYQLNSGQAAILVACLMGGSPVYPVGMDCWTFGPRSTETYWHDPDADVVCMRQQGRRIPVQLDILSELCYGYDVRPQSGPLLSIFPLPNQLPDTTS